MFIWWCNAFEYINLLMHTLSHSLQCWVYECGICSFHIIAPMLTLCTVLDIEVNAKACAWNVRCQCRSFLFLMVYMPLKTFIQHICRSNVTQCHRKCFNMSKNRPIFRLEFINESSLKITDKIVYLPWFNLICTCFDWNLLAMIFFYLECNMCQMFIIHIREHIFFFVRGFFFLCCSTIHFWFIEIFPSFGFYFNWKIKWSNIVSSNSHKQTNIYTIYVVFSFYIW